MKRITVSAVATALFVAFIGGVLALNAAALRRQRDSTTLITVASRQQALAEQYLQEVLLYADGHAADPADIMDQMITTQDALRSGGQVLALQGSPDDDLSVHGLSNARVLAKLAGQERIVQHLRDEGNAYMAQAVDDGHPSARQLLQMRVTTAQLWTTTRDLVGEMTRQSNAEVDRLVTAEIVFGMLGIVAALGLSAIFGRSARQRARPASAPS